MLDSICRFDTTELTALLVARPDLADPAPKTVIELAARAVGAISLDACRRSLDRGARQVLEALCLLPAPITVGHLAGLLGVDDHDADLAAVLHRLSTRVLIGRQGDQLELLAQVEVRHPAGLGPPARVALASQSAIVLAGCAERLGVGAGATKAATLERIGAALSTPGLLPALLADAPDGAAELAVHLAFEGPEGRAPGAVYAAARAEQTAVGWLVSRGVLAPTGWDLVILVGEAGLALRGGKVFPELHLGPPEVRVHPVDPIAADRAAAERALRLVADVASILDGWADDGPGLLKAGGLGIQAVRRVAKVIGRSEVETARVIELTAAAGLVSIDAHTDAVLPLPAYDRWSELDVAGRWAHLVAAWGAWDLHLGLVGAIDTKGKPIPPLLVRAPEAHAEFHRAAVLAAMAEVPPGHAIAPDSLYPKVSWDAPARWAGGVASRDLLASWTSAECELLGLSGLGALSTWGRLVAGGDIDGARRAFDEVVPAATSEFTVQPDLTAFAPAELVRSVHAELESMAELESRGAAVVYRFTEASVRRSHEAGRTSSDILGFLEAHAAKGVPQALTYLVNDVGRRFGQLRAVATRCCLRSDDTALLAEVVASRPAKKLGLRLLAPTVASATADVATVLTALRDAGYAPAEEGADGALVLRRPARRRAKPNPHLTALTRRRPGQSAAFGPVGDPFAAPEAMAAAAFSDGADTDRDRRSAAAAVVAARLVRSASAAGAAVGDGARPSKAVVAAPPISVPLFPPASNGFPTSAFDVAPSAGRPEMIARDPVLVADLLELAMVEGWPVRMAYTSKKGHSAQLNVAVLDIGRNEVVVELLSGWESRVLALSRVSWVRILTEAEEDAV